MVLTHLDEELQPSMVDVSEKQVTKRIALARTRVLLPAEAMVLLKDGEIRSAKGPVFQTAIIAGVMAAKKTHELIPFCHAVALEDCKVTMGLNAKRQVVIDCKVTTHGKTGVEMEALTGASIAALTIYDMCKSISHNIVIEEVRLVEKTGGKSDFSSDSLRPRPSRWPEYPDGSS